ncbi:hypothetical protein AB0E55_26620 [Amycolatopsis keratiniphila]|uniref:hypothetical protein n=1 Tax=Amycolatopsis keratiniphila TaxID=129921 RepID=UPI0033CCE328
MNNYQHGRHAAPLVLTCRTGHYQALTDADVWAHDAALVTIDPVSSAKAREFIESRVNNPARWQTVLSTIDHHPGGPLAVGLSTPWRLSLATTVYEQRDPDSSYSRDPADLIRVAATSNHALREHLLTHFITATIAARAAQSDKPAPYTAGQTHRWLAILARYLHNNAATGRVFDGVPLSGTDLVLHQLWPLVGIHRVRGIVLAATALIWLIATPILLIHNGTGLSTGQIAGFAVPGIGFFGWTCLIWNTVGLPPNRIHTRQLRTQKGRRTLAISLVSGLIAGLVGGLELELQVRLAVGLAAGITFGLGFWIWLSNERKDRQEHDAASITWDPREIIKHDLVAGLVIGLSIGLSVGLVAGLTYGLAVALTWGLAVALTFGEVGVRYLALLLCTRGWFGTPELPWRLGRFLHWCYHAGLIRQAGIGYQFRHRELQNHLANKPATSTVSG